MYHSALFECCLFVDLVYHHHACLPQQTCCPPAAAGDECAVVQAMAPPRFWLLALLCGCYLSTWAEAIHTTTWIVNDSSKTFSVEAYKVSGADFSDTTEDFIRKQNLAPNQKVCKYALHAQGV